MDNMGKAVVRFADGRLLKGYLRDFSPDGESFSVEDAGSGVGHTVDISSIKALFFVKDFGGDPEYNEKKSYGMTRSKGNRVFIKFRDGESMVGFLEGDVPWEKGFFLSKKSTGNKGFYLLPVDEDSNNIKVFVVASYIHDVTVVPVTL